MTSTTFLPQAWLGYAVPRRGASKACVRVCRSCPDRAEAEREAKQGGLDVQLTTCSACCVADLEKRGLW